jgi:hypothetical protein
LPEAFFFPSAESSRVAPRIEESGVRKLAGQRGHRFVHPALVPRSARSETAEFVVASRLLVGLLEVDRRC